MSSNIVDNPELREQTQVFEGRSHAAQVLAGMMASHDLQDGIILAIPAGGVPVGARMAEETGLDLDVAVVSKITLPWNSEAGYGAVAFDGTLKLNEEMVRNTELTEQQVEQGIRTTKSKVARRVRALRGSKPRPELVERPAILVDDGLASGFTMRVAVAALRRAGTKRILVAVPTAHTRAAEMIAREVEVLYCANIRSGFSYAVASAYRHWVDVTEDEAKAILARHAGDAAEKMSF